MYDSVRLAIPREVRDSLGLDGGFEEIDDWFDADDLVETPGHPEAGELGG